MDFEAGNDAYRAYIAGWSHDMYTKKSFSDCDVIYA
jgi:hypothetical protein